MKTELSPRSTRAWQAFQSVVTELGGEVLEPCWKGSIQPHRVVCASGHESAVRPNNLKNGQGLCATCAGRNPWSTEAEFRKAVSAAGAFVLGLYRGTHVPVEIRCLEGHRASPTPHSVLHGNGVCRTCAGSTWDAFYVVSGPNGVKFGITSRDGRARLADHRRDGYTEVHRLATGLPGTTAVDLERELIGFMRALCVQPVRGREYYPASVLRQVLAVADEWLAA